MRTEAVETRDPPSGCTLCPVRSLRSESRSRNDPTGRYFAKSASNTLKAHDNLKSRNLLETAGPDPVVDYSSPLSVRECEILVLSAKGLTNRGISKTLSISRHTVKRHFDNIFNKLGVNNRTLAVVWAVRHGLI